VKKETCKYTTEEETLLVNINENIPNSQLTIEMLNFLTIVEK
jgi:hypothetical protein